MLTNRLFQFSIAAVLILAAVLATTSAINLPKVAAGDLSQYYRSERTSVEFTGAGKPDMTTYHQSEWNSSDGMPVIRANNLEVYRQSERILIPLRDLERFSVYQISEWFGR